MTYRDRFRSTDYVPMQGPKTIPMMNAESVYDERCRSDQVVLVHLNMFGNRKGEAEGYTSARTGLGPNGSTMSVDDWTRDR